MVGLCVMMVFSVPWLDWIILFLIVATTLASGIEYFIRNYDALGLGGNSH